LKFNPLHTKEVVFEAIQPTLKIAYSIEDLKQKRDPVLNYLNIMIPFSTLK
jgi:hypothetical protein